MNGGIGSLIRGRSVWSTGDGDKKVRRDLSKLYATDLGTRLED